MDRNETINSITMQLSTLDDDQVEAIADFVESVAANETLPRELTARELALIEQSKQDFRAGRTYSLDEMDAYLDAAAQRRTLARTA